MIPTSDSTVDLLTPERMTDLVTSIGKSSLTISAKPVGVGVVSQPWILAAEQSVSVQRPGASSGTASTNRSLRCRSLPFAALGMGDQNHRLPIFTDECQHGAFLRRFFSLQKARYRSAR
jgi:hypothetical protein